VAVDTDPDTDKKRGRLADVNQAWVRIADVAGQRTRLSACIDQARVMFALDQPEGRTAFHVPGGADQPFADRSSREDLIGKRSLAVSP